MKHPTNESLLAFCLEPAGGAPPDRGPEVSDHLARGCRRCDGRIQEYRALLAALRAPLLADPPQGWVGGAVERIRDELRRRPARRSAAAKRAEAGLRAVRGAARAFRARLVLDSGREPALAGIRGVSQMQPRQLLYQSPMGRLHLQIVHLSGGRIEINGQFLPAGEIAGRERGAATLEQEGRKQAKRLSMTGEFRFGSVRPGTISLQIEWSGSVLMVEGVRL